jgi:hypothetical protein
MGWTALWGELLIGWEGRRIIDANAQKLGA